MRRNIGINHASSRGEQHQLHTWLNNIEKQAYSAKK